MLSELSMMIIFRGRGEESVKYHILMWVELIKQMYKI